MSRSSSGTYCGRSSRGTTRKVSVQHQRRPATASTSSWKGRTPGSLWNVTATAGTARTSGTRTAPGREYSGAPNWTFERIRGSAFYRDPDTALLPLWQRLADLGIPTGDWWSTETRSRSSVKSPALVSHFNQVERTEDATRRRTARARWRLSLCHADMAVAATTRDGARTHGTLPPKPVVSAMKTTAAVDAERARSHSGAPPVSAGRIPQPPPSPVRDRIGTSLLTYQAWQPHPLPHPDRTPPSQLVTGLVEIVAAQGPLHAQHAFRVYTQAAGGQRVGAEIRRALQAATRNALRTGALHRALQGSCFSPTMETLYATGQPPVLLRELGTRQLSDVPRSEVNLIKLLNSNT